MIDPTSHTSPSERDDDTGSRDSYPPEPAPRFRFYVNGREVTAEEAASAARAEAPEMVTETVDGAVPGRSGYRPW